MKYIDPSDRSQYQMMSSLDDSIEQDNPVRIIDIIVDKIVLSNKDIYMPERQQQSGRSKYPERLLLKLLLYGYFNGISSSRRLEIETHRNKEVIWLLGNLMPDHWTISNFRKLNGENIKLLTKQFRKFLKETGYISLKTVAIDGTKLKANANRDMLSKQKIEERLERIEEKIEEYLNRITENDKRDDLLDEIEDKAIENVNKEYLDKIIMLQRQLEELQGKKDILEQKGLRHISITDSDARMMKSRDGFIPGYNLQIAVDQRNKMIVDSEVVMRATDSFELPNMIQSIKQEVGASPDEVIADGGYNTPDLIEQLESDEPEVEVFVAQSQKTGRQSNQEIKFNYDEQKDEYICSEGKSLVLINRRKKKKNSFANVYKGIECDQCPLKSKCTKSKNGRIITRYVNQKWRDNFRQKMLSSLAKIKIRLRKTLVEHPFGTIKYLMGKIPLKLRGIIKVSIEINLYTTVYNLKRLINIEPNERLIEKISSYNWIEA